MEKSVRVTEREYSKKMQDLNRGFEAGGYYNLGGLDTHLPQSVGQSFSTMETKMNEVGRTAVRIGALQVLPEWYLTADSRQGEQLESVHQHRERAKAAHDLVDYYNQFSRDDVSRLDSLKKEGKEGRRQVAVILRRLVIVAKEVDLPYAEKVNRPPPRKSKWLTIGTFRLEK